MTWDETKQHLRRNFHELTDTIGNTWEYKTYETGRDFIADTTETVAEYMNGGRGQKRTHDQIGASADSDGWDTDNFTDSNYSSHYSSSSSSDNSTAPMPNRDHPDVGRQRIAGTGQNVRSSSDEVPVMPPPAKISKIHPDYFTISLPYIQRGSTGSVVNFSGSSSKPWAVVRLNSIYDPIRDNRQFAVDAEGTALIDPVTASNSQPQGRDIWAAHFKFYRVLKTYVRLEFFSTRTVDQTEDNPVPFKETYVVGYELIDSDGAVSDSADMFQLTKNAKREYLGPAIGNLNRSTNGTEVRSVTRPSMTAMEYVYSPHAWTGHVQEEGSESRWTPVGENPSIEHDMAIRVMHLTNAQADNNPGQIGVIVKISYEVQFREAIDSFFKTRLTTQATDPDPSP